MEKTVFILLLISVLLSAAYGQMCPCNTQNGCNQNQNYPTCGCNQNQNYYGGIMNRFGQPMSPACQGPLPCYDVVISQLTDGPMKLLVVNNDQEFLQPYSRAGMTRRDLIAKGREAAVYFRDTYGVDFTSMPDTAFLSGRRMNAEGVEFGPFIFGPSARYRMYMASTNSGAQLFNRPISDQGWMLNFTRPMWGRGSFRKLIPADAMVVNGQYIIHPCGMPSMDDFSRPCSNILNPQDPWAPLVITYKSPTYIKFVNEPYPFLPLDCILEHPVWGEGRGRAMVTVRDTEENIVDSRMTLTFPSNK